jgi:hypothetical protein
MTYRTAGTSKELLSCELLAIPAAAADTPTHPKSRKANRGQFSHVHIRAPWDHLFNLPPLYASVLTMQSWRREKREKEFAQPGIDHSSNALFSGAGRKVLTSVPIVREKSKSSCLTAKDSEPLPHGESTIVYRIDGMRVPSLNAATLEYSRYKTVILISLSVARVHAARGISHHCTVPF